jgi:hypothetical protein
MSGMSPNDSRDDDIANLKAQASRQQDALKQIAARCRAVNYPPDLVVEIAALAQGALPQAGPGPAPRAPPQGDARA